MSGPGFARSDLCSIRTADWQGERADAVRDGPSAAAPRSDDDLPAPRTSGIDRAIRLSTAVAVLAVAGISAYVSYWHAYGVVRAYGETGITARLEPATIDGLVYASSMVVLYAARHRVPVPSLARWLLGLGIAATIDRAVFDQGSASPLQPPGPLNFVGQGPIPPYRYTGCLPPGVLYSYRYCAEGRLWNLAMTRVYGCHFAIS